MTTLSHKEIVVPAHWYEKKHFPLMWGDQDHVLLKGSLLRVIYYSHDCQYHYYDEAIKRFVSKHYSGRVVDEDGTDAVISDLVGRLIDKHPMHSTVRHHIGDFPCRVIIDGKLIPNYLLHDTSIPFQSRRRLASAANKVLVKIGLLLDELN